MKKIIITVIKLLISGLIASYVILSTNKEVPNVPDIVAEDNSNNTCMPEVGC